MKIKELSGTNLIAVEVPIDIKDFKFYKYFKSGIWIGEENPIGLNAWKISFSISGDFKILGTVTKDKIGFDVEPYVENCSWKDAPDGYSISYKDYVNGKETNDFEDMHLFDNSEESFYSMLEANLLYFVNPMNKISASEFGHLSIDEFNNKWKSFEDSLISGNLLIIEKL